ncbi:phage tail protein I, partial [Pseudomonas fragi]
MSDSSLLPSNRVSLEQALAQLSTGDVELANVLRQVHSVENCPAALLPWLAIQRSVDRWDPEWSETIKRKVVKDAFEVHKRKGT